MSVLERRLHPRVMVPGMSATVVDSGSRRSRRVTILDVSEDGARWHDPDPAKPGVFVSVTIRTGRFFGRTFQLQALIVRADADSAAARFLTAPQRADFGSMIRRHLTGRSPAAAERGAAGSDHLTAALSRLAISLERGALDRPRIIAVASPREGDGKSFIAAGLALALARMDRRVLLVDADLQSPTQHSRFFANGAPGLAQLLDDPLRPAGEFVQRTSRGVSLIAAGAAGSITSFGPQAIKDVAAVLRDLDYSMVIVDGAPLLTSADALPLSQISDGTILTVRSGITRERDVKQALELLDRNGTPALGVVLNDHVDIVSGRPPLAPVALSVSAATVETPRTGPASAAAEARPAVGRLLI